jgi:outer membrane receptor protein involved in Fe transport
VACRGRGSLQLAAFGPGLATNIGSTQGSLFSVRFTQYQISDDVVKSRGNHKLGFGMSFHAHPANVLFSSDLGTLVPFTLNSFYQGGFDPATPSTDATQLTQSFSSQLLDHFFRYILGFYAQDEWHPRPDLTVTVALRTEHQSNQVCENRCFARLKGPFGSVSHDPDQPYNQAILINLDQAYESMNKVLWAPRFSFAWQPLGVSHNTVLRGGIGFFMIPYLPSLPTSFSTTHHSSTSLRFRVTISPLMKPRACSRSRRIQTRSF